MPPERHNPSLPSLHRFLMYFLKLGCLGFGGLVALVGCMIVLLSGGIGLVIWLVKQS